MDGLVFIIGVIGNIISILMFLSPVKTFVRIVKNKSTEEFESLPYICILLSSSLWIVYGITKPGSYLVATVNGIGVVFEIVYLVLFLIYAPPRKRVRTGILVGSLNVGFVAVTLLATYFLLGEEQRIDAIGLMSSCLNIIMYASPLSAMEIELHFGLAVKSQNATLYLKRKLACEQLSFYAQASFCLSEMKESCATLKQQLFFLKWKHLEAKGCRILLPQSNPRQGHRAILPCQHHLLLPCCRGTAS